MKGLTKRQSEVLDFIREFILKNNHSPSFSEIGHHLQLKSLSSVSKHVMMLTKKGHLNFQANGKRTLYPTLVTKSSSKENLSFLPLIGKLTIGERLETYPRAESLAIPDWMFASNAENTYLIRNEQDHEEEFLQKGDLLMIEGRSEPFDGERVLALFHHSEPVIKTFYKKEGFITLESQHAAVYPLIVREEDIAIQGIFLGIVRTV